jgi:hypothetical protein
MKKLIFLALIIALIVVMCGGCAQPMCPAYQDNYQAMGHRFNEWNGNKKKADFCKPPKKKKSTF